MQSFIKELQERGILDNQTAGLSSLSPSISAYVGFDPTAPSLHIGHWIGICFLRRLAQHGVTPLALVGGATGMIGDPSGKSAERVLLRLQEIQANALSIEKSLKHYLPNIQIVNNADWIQSMSVIDFLRDVGKYFRLGPMLAKDTIKQRVFSEEGISYTEFSYILLQSLDFAYLFQHYGVVLQCGGSDQWGNITAGIDYIRKKGLGSAYGLTYPLLTNSQGKKIGKTESGTLWLDPQLTSPYTLYQYFIRLPDSEFPKILRTLTLLSNEHVFQLEEQLRQDPIATKKEIAGIIVSDIHGEHALSEAKAITQKMFLEKQDHITEEDCRQLLSAGQGMILSKESVLGKSCLDVFVLVGLCASKGAGRRLVAQRGLYINNQPLANENCIFNDAHLLFGSFILLSLGKKKKLLVHVK